MRKSSPSQGSNLPDSFFAVLVLSSRRSGDLRWPKLLVETRKPILLG